MGSRTRRVVRGGTSDELSTRGQRSSEEVDTASDDMPFVRLTRSSVNWAQAALRRVKTAVIGPDFTGNVRGIHAFDIQSVRGAATNVASGDESIAFGTRNEASGFGSFALGRDNVASGSTGIAIGEECEASGPSGCSVAIGASAIASGDESVALGVEAEAPGQEAYALGGLATKEKSVSVGRFALCRIERMLVVGAVPGIPHAWSTTPLDWMIYGAGSEALIFSHALNLKTVTDYVLSLPTGCKFILSECGLLLTALTALTTQPTIRFGTDGSLAASLSPFLTSDLTAVGARERFLPDNLGAGVTSLSFGVTHAAVATTLKGRAYWKGVLVEDES